MENQITLPVDEYNKLYFDHMKLDMLMHGIVNSHPILKGNDIEFNGMELTQLIRILFPVTYRDMVEETKRKEFQHGKQLLQKDR